MLNKPPRLGLPGLIVSAFLVLTATPAPAGAAPPKIGGPQWKYSQAYGLREAVLRWQIAQYRKSGEICFVTVSETSPENEAFVRRFQGGAFLKPLSRTGGIGPHAVVLSKPKTGSRFLDAVSGKPALHFWINGVHWRSATVAEVEGGGAAGLHSGDFGTFTVVRCAGRWAVAGYRKSALT